MARRRRTDANPLPYFLALIALFALAILGPVAALIWWILCEMKAREVGAVTSISQLLASNQEALAIETADAEQAESLSKRALIQEGAQANDVPHRADGMYDGRSRKGREANEALQAAAELGDNAITLRLAIEAQIQERVEDWVSRTANLAGARAGLVGYFPLLLLAFLVVHHLLFAGALASLGTVGVVWIAAQVCRAQLLAGEPSDSTSNGVLPIPLHPAP